VKSEKPHKKLVLWQKAIGFVVLVYEVTKSFPREEEFGLKSQLRRAAVSVPSNVAEGLSRKTAKDKLHFLNLVQASLSEIDAQIEVSLSLGFISKESSDKLDDALSEVERLLNGLMKSIRVVKQ
jgi:four helix bundle protein